MELHHFSISCAYNSIFRFWYHVTSRPAYPVKKNLDRVTLKEILRKLVCDCVAMENYVIDNRMDDSVGDRVPLFNFIINRVAVIVIRLTAPWELYVLLKEQTNGEYFLYTERLRDYFETGYYYGFGSLLNLNIMVRLFGIKVTYCAIGAFCQWNNFRNWIRNYFQR